MILRSSHFYNIQCDAGGYSSMQVSPPFIQIPRTPLHHMLSIQLMDAGPLGVDGGRDGGEGNAREDWLCVSLGRQGMIPNVRPDREIQHTSDAQPRYPTLFCISCWRHFRMLFPLPCFIVFPNFRALTIRKISIFRFIMQDHAQS